MGTDEEIRDRLKALNARLEEQGKPKKPEHINAGPLNTVVADLGAISRGEIVIDLPEVKNAVTLDQATLNANIADIASGKFDVGAAQAAKK